MWALFAFLAPFAALLTIPPVINLPDPSVIHLPPVAHTARRIGVRGLLPAPRSRPLLPMGWQPAGLLSWRGASTFRALAVVVAADVL